MKRSVNCEFCDDVRHEVGDKFSLMGIYTADMNVPSLPIVIPKLCVVATYKSAIDDVPDSLIFKVFLNETLLYQNIVEKSSLLEVKKAFDATNNRDDPFTEFASGAHFYISPLLIDKVSNLRVMVEINGEDQYAGKLRIGTPRR